jgi:hypothetical protein
MAICRKKIATKTGKKTQLFYKITDLPNYFLQIQIQHIKFSRQTHYQTILEKQSKKKWKKIDFGVVFPRKS